MLHMDVGSGEVYLNGSIIGRLNYSDRLVLECLILAQKQIVSRDILLKAGWPSRIVVPNSLNIAVKNIRKILEVAGYKNEPETIPRQGFRLGIDISIDKAIAKNEGDIKISTEVGIRDHNTVVDDITVSIDEIYNVHTDGSPSHLAVVRKKTSFNIYITYILFLIVPSAFFLVYRKVHEPNFVCTEVNKVVFCGSHKVDVKHLPLNTKPGEKYWFVESENERTFIKIN